MMEADLMEHQVKSEELLWWGESERGGRERSVVSGLRDVDVPYLEEKEGLSLLSYFYVLFIDSYVLL